MGSSGKVSLELTLASSADKFWDAIFDFRNVVVKACSDSIKSSKIVEGDGKSAGSIISFDLVEGISPMTSIQKRIKSVDEKNMVLKYEFVGYILTEVVSSIRASDHVVPNENGQGCTMKWTGEHEDVSSDAVVQQNFYSGFVNKCFLDIDAYLAKN